MPHLCRGPARAGPLPRGSVLLIDAGLVQMTREGMETGQPTSHMLNRCDHGMSYRNKGEKLIHGGQGAGGDFLEVRFVLIIEW